MTWWKGVIAGVLFLGAAGITVRGLSDRPPPAVEAQTSKVKKGTITRTVTGAGKVQAATTVKISSNISGDLISLNVKVGDKVKKGQVLGQIDRRRYEALTKQALAGQSVAKADVQAAEVEVERTKTELGRVQALLGKSMASSAELDQAKAAYDAAVARLASSKERLAQASAAYDQAASDLSKTTLVSPIDGDVIEVTREVGERVRGSDFNEDVVLTLAALNAMEVKIEVGEHEVVHLALGQKAEVTVDALEGQTFEGTVTEIAQKALIKNPGTEAEVTTFPVTVSLLARPPGVLPGMSSEVRINAQTRADALIVPIQAVTVRPDKSLPDAKTQVETGTTLTAKKRTETLAKVVFVVDEHKKVHPRRIRTGISSETEFEILDGLQEGDTIVEGPYRVLAKDLKDGDEVRPPDMGKGPGRS